MSRIRLFPAALLGSLLIAAPCLAAPPASDVGVGRTHLQYLSQYDQDAISLLTCADILHKDSSRFPSMGRKETGKLAKVYEKAGRAAVVKASLNAVHSPFPPQVESVLWKSPEARLMVEGDLVAHRIRAADFSGGLRDMGFDISNSCVSPRLLDKAAELNAWFLHDTSLLKDVK